MYKKAIRIYLIISISIGIIIFLGIFERSDRYLAGWKDIEVKGEIDNFVYIGKSIFIKIDSLYVEVLYNPYFKRNNPIGNMFIKNKGEEFYSISDINSTDTISSSKGGIVDHKIWLKRIDTSLQKKEEAK